MTPESLNCGLRPNLIVVGPMPPPVGGFSAATLAMVRAFTESGRFNATTVINRSIKPSNVRARKFQGYLVMMGMGLFAHIRAMFQAREKTVYVALSGGSGQWLDAVFVVISRLARCRIFFHHHSYRYVNRFHWRFRFLLFVAGECQHISLCDDMRTRLSAMYGIPVDSIRTVSNAALIPFNTTHIQQLTKSDQIRVGFLGNITKEKGIFIFFEAVRKAQKLGLPIKAFVAGPIDDAIVSEFSYYLKSLPFVDYLGPIYNVEKERFFNDLDVLLFPSMYVNEAEPLTILEALSSGVSVFCTARGCCSDFRSANTGAVRVFEVSSFADESAELLVQTAGKYTAARRSEAQALFNGRKASAQFALAQVIIKMAGGLCAAK